jgi:hypothetical protein
VTRIRLIRRATSHEVDSSCSRILNDDVEKFQNGEAVVELCGLRAIKILDLCKDSMLIVMSVAQ